MNQSKLNRTKKICFDVIVLLNWMYFKFLLCYQQCVMKRYNQNFIFRKKGQSHSGNISQKIIEYFHPGNAMSTYSVINDKNKDITIFQALYVGAIDCIIFNREICTLLYSIILVGAYLISQIELFLVISTLFVSKVSTTFSKSPPAPSSTRPTATPPCSASPSCSRKDSRQGEA